MVIVTESKIAKQNVLPVNPKFKNPSTMTQMELTDPDYRLKKLAIENGQNPSEMLICSKRHHCR